MIKNKFASGAAWSTFTPAAHSYQDLTSTKSQIMADGFFDDIYDKLEKGDFIMINSSQGSTIIEVTSETKQKPVKVRYLQTAPTGNSESTTIRLDENTANEFVGTFPSVHTLFNLDLEDPAHTADIHTKVFHSFDNRILGATLILPDKVIAPNTRNSVDLFKEGWDNECKVKLADGSIVPLTELARPLNPKLKIADRLYVGSGGLEIVQPLRLEWLLASHITNWQTATGLSTGPTAIMIGKMRVDTGFLPNGAGVHDLVDINDDVVLDYTTTNDYSHGFQGYNGDVIRIGFNSNVLFVTLEPNGVSFNDLIVGPDHHFWFSDVHLFQKNLNA